MNKITIVDNRTLRSPVLRKIAEALATRYRVTLIGFGRKEFKTKLQPNLIYIQLKSIPVCFSRFYYTYSPIFSSFTTTIAKFALAMEKRRLMKLLYETRPDLLCTFHWHSCSVLNDIRKNLNIPLVTIVDDLFYVIASMPFPRAKGLHRSRLTLAMYLSVEKEAYTMVDKVFALSRADVEYLKKIYGVNAIYLGVGPLLHPTKIKQSKIVLATYGLKKREYCLYSGSSAYNKYVYPILEQIAVQLPEEMIVVTGKQRQVSTQLNIRYVGFVPVEEYFSLVKSSKAILAPIYGWRGGFPMKVVDGLTCRRPCVVSPGIAMCFPKDPSGKTIWIAKDVDDIVRALKKISNMNSDELSTKINTYVKDNLSWAIVVEKFCAGINSL